MEVVAVYMSTALTAFAIYASFTFAYLTAAYFVGSKLSGFQSALVSTLYVASGIVTTSSSYAMVQGWGEMVSIYPTLLDNLPVYSFRGWHYYITAVMLAGIFASLYFMHDIRSKSRGKPNES